MPTETEELAALRKEFALFRRDVLMKSKELAEYTGEVSNIDDMLTKLGLLGGDVPVVIKMMVPVTCVVEVSEVVASMDYQSQMKHFAKAKVDDVVFSSQIGFSMTSTDAEEPYAQPAEIEIGDIVLTSIERKTPPPPAEPYPGYSWAYSNGTTARVRHLFPAIDGGRYLTGRYYASSLCNEITTYRAPVDNSAQAEFRDCQRCTRRAANQ